MLIPADTTIVRAIVFRMLRAHPYGHFRSGQEWVGNRAAGNPGSPYAKGQLIDTGGTSSLMIKFQFPPRITSDGRTGSWQEEEMPGDQAVSVYKTSAARKMTLEWTYIVGEYGGGSLVDGVSESDKPWSAAEIKWNLSALRAYYSQYFGTGRGFIVEFLYGYHGDPNEVFTCRFSTLDFTHKGGIIIGGTYNKATGKIIEGTGNTAFPLRTDVKVSMQLWTLGAAPAGMGDEKNAKKKSAKFDIGGLRQTVGDRPQWE